jgi:hypothetical protein
VRTEPSPHYIKKRQNKRENKIDLTLKKRQNKRENKIDLHERKTLNIVFEYKNITILTVKPTRTVKKCFKIII